MIDTNILWNKYTISLTGLFFLVLRSKADTRTRDTNGLTKHSTLADLRRCFVQEWATIPSPGNYPEAYVLFQARMTKDNMEANCGSKLSLITKKIYQMKLELYDDDIYDYRKYKNNVGGTCETNIEAWYNTYRKLMIYFEDLKLDCKDGHVEFFFITGRNSRVRVKGLEKNICGYNKPFGVFTVDTRYLYIKYVPTKKQYTSRLFSLVVTSYRDDSCPSYAFDCKNSRCIDEDLACNGFDSCGDGSGCELGNIAIVGILIGSLIGLALIVGVFVCLVCYKKRRKIPHADVSERSAANQQEMPRQNIGIGFVDIPPATGAPSPIQDAPSLRTYWTLEELTNVIQDNSEDQQNGYDSLPPSYTELFGNNHL